MHNQQTGKTGEEIAADYLRKKGFTILERNWRFRYWEVDIIASYKGFLHFVEVKTRISLRYGRPEESITREKMRSLKNVAEEYQYLHPEWKYIQFDVLAITLVKGEPREIFMIEDVYF